MEAIRNELEQARRSLLDLTRRNRLINFKPRGRTSLKIVDEIPAEIYRILAIDQKTMRFLPIEESPVYQNGNYDNQGEFANEDDGFTSFDLPDDENGELLAERHTDDYLQTALSGDKLQRRLLHLSREAESALQERGCNILFIAIGLLEWTEREDSLVKSRAPAVTGRVKTVLPHFW